MTHTSNKNKNLIVFILLVRYSFQLNHSKSKYPTQRSEQHTRQCNSNSNNSVIQVSLQQTNKEINYSKTTTTTSI